MVAIHRKKLHLVLLHSKFAFKQRDAIIDILNALPPRIAHSPTSPAVFFRQPQTPAHVHGRPQERRFFVRAAQSRFSVRGFFFFMPHAKRPVGRIHSASQLAPEVKKKAPAGAHTLSAPSGRLTLTGGKREARSPRNRGARRMPSGIAAHARHIADSRAPHQSFVSATRQASRAAECHASDCEGSNTRSTA